MDKVKRAILGMALVSLAVLTVSGTASADDHHGLPSSGGDGSVGDCEYRYRANPNDAEVSANVHPGGFVIVVDGFSGGAWCNPLDSLTETRTL